MKKTVIGRCAPPGMLFALEPYMYGEHGFTSPGWGVAVVAFRECSEELACRGKSRMRKETNVPIFIY